MVRLKVQAAPAPKPALKYQLLPELREMNPGNPVLGYLKCFADKREFFYGKEASEERRKWEALPLKDLPLAKLRNYGGMALRQADYAARLDNPDWQMLLRLKKEGLNLDISELNEMRHLAYHLKWRLIGEIAERRFDEALVTTKTFFAMARHFGEYPHVVGNIVGIVFANEAVEQLGNMLQQTCCPNLFWALTDLPNPFIDYRRGFQGYRMMMLNEFGILDKNAAMTDAQLQKVVNHFQSVMNTYFIAKKSKPDVREMTARLVKNKAHVIAARKRLEEHGLAVDKVQQFPALQVVLLDELVTYEERLDDAMKAMSLPFWQAAPLLAAYPLVTKGRGYGSMDEDASPLPQLLSNVARLPQAKARLEQRFAVLRCIEALRLHAAEHDGKLPTKLADIKLPLPVDPVNGQPFSYKLEAGTAHLRGAPPPGLEKNAHYNVRYEVTIRP